MPNGGVDRAARIHACRAGPIKLQDTLPPLRSNELFDAALNNYGVTSKVISFVVFQGSSAQQANVRLRNNL